MPEERKVFDIAKPVATPAARPVISSGPPAPDPMVKPATKVSVNVLDSSTPGEIADVEPAPAPTSVPVSVSVIEEAPEPGALQPEAPAETNEQPASVDVASEVEPQIDNIAVNTPPEAVAETALPMDASGSSAITPGLPGAPASDFSNVPKFGELQSKVDAHPLFSGNKEHRVKVRRMPRFVKPLTVLVVLFIVAYLAIDAGVVRGSSHLPFHIFKQKPVASATPIIGQSAATQAEAATTPSQTSQQTSTSSGNSASTSTPTTTAASKAYDDTVNKFITAMRNKDKKTADSLESPALAVSTKKEAKTTSFYDACQSAGVYCTGLFGTSFIGAAETATKDYKAQDGTVGKETTYTVKTAVTGASGASTNVLTIAAIPNADSWLIDFVDASGGTNFVSNN